MLIEIEVMNWQVERHKQTVAGHDKNKGRSLNSGSSKQGQTLSLRLLHGSAGF